MHQEKQKIEKLLQNITQNSDAKLIQGIANQIGDIDNEATGALLGELIKAHFKDTLLEKALSDLENLGRQKSSDKNQYQRVLDSVVSSADLTLIGSNSDNRVYVMQLITLLKGLYKRSQKNGYSMVKDNLSKSYTGKSREQIAKYFEDAAIKLLGQLSAEPLIISVQGVVDTETHTTISTHIEQKTIQNGQSVESKIDISFSEDKHSTVRYETHKQNTAYLPPEIVDKSQRFKKLMTEIDAESIDEKQIDILLNEINNFKASLSSSGLKLNAQKIQFEKDYKEYQFLLNTLLKEHSLDQMHSLIKEGTKKRELYQASLEELELKDKVHPDGMTHFSKNSDEEKLLNSLSESYQSGKSGPFFSPSSWKNWFTLRETKQLLQAQLKNSIEETDEKLTILEDTYKNGLFLLKMAKDVSAQMQEKETAQKNMASLRQDMEKIEQKLREITTLQGRQRELENILKTFENLIMVSSNNLSRLIMSPKVKGSGSAPALELKREIDGNIKVFNEISLEKNKVTVQLSLCKGTLFPGVTEQRRVSLTSESYTRHFS